MKRVRSGAPDEAHRGGGVCHTVTLACWDTTGVGTPPGAAAAPGGSATARGGAGGRPGGAWPIIIGPPSGGAIMPAG